VRRRIINMLKFLSFSSGSCGNCYFLYDGEKGLLIDAGVSLRRVRKALMEKGLGFDAIRCLLLTHDHMDHIRHLETFCKKLSVPVYATSILHEAMINNEYTDGWVGDCRRDLSDNGPTEVLTGVLVKYFIVPHDASQTVGYSIEWCGRHFVLMTDIGAMTEEAIEYAKAADTLVIESNYDLPMLLKGGYPAELKKRIRGGNGHLSNDECADTIRKVWHEGLRNIFLCHLSDNNNTPMAAFESASEALQGISREDGCTAKDVTYLHALPRGRVSPFFEI
jgi:phosphoribosyl 1,2-cyclic phosphodiesterase